MAQRGEDFGFTLEPREAFGIVRHRRRRDFEAMMKSPLQLTARGVDVEISTGQVSELAR